MIVCWVKIISEYFNEIATFFCFLIFPKENFLVTNCQKLKMLFMLVRMLHRMSNERLSVCRTGLLRRSGWNTFYLPRITQYQLLLRKLSRYFAVRKILQSGAFVAIIIGTLLLSISWWKSSYVQVQKSFSMLFKLIQRAQAVKVNTRHLSWTRMVKKP